MITKDGVKMTANKYAKEVILDALDSVLEGCVVGSIFLGFGSICIYHLVGSLWPYFSRVGCVLSQPDRGQCK